MQTKKKYCIFFTIIVTTGLIVGLFKSASLKDDAIIILNQSDGNSWDIPIMKKKQVDNHILLQEHSLLKSHLLTIENRVKKDIVITTAVCGVHRINETIVMIKSAIYFSNVKLKFIIFADEMTNESLRDALQQKIKIKNSSSRHEYEIRPMQFPIENGINWKNIFRPCACQRLFFPVSMNFLLFFLSLINFSKFFILNFILNRVCCQRLIPFCTWTRTVCF